MANYTPSRERIGKGAHCRYGIYLHDVLNDGYPTRDDVSLSLVPLLPLQLSATAPQYRSLCLHVLQHGVPKAGQVQD